MTLVSKFLVWWGGQLMSLLPHKITHFLANLSPRLVIAVEDGTEYSHQLKLSRVERGATLPIENFSLEEESLQNLARTIKRYGNGMAVRLKVPSPWLVHKDIPMPAAVTGHLETAMAYEMDRETPFTPDMVYWRAAIVAKRPDRREVIVRLTLIQKRRLENIVTHLHAAGIFPDPLEGADMIEGGTIRLHGGHTSRRPLYNAGFAFSLLIAAAIAAPFIHQSHALGVADDRIAMLRPQVAEAAALRQKLGVSGRSTTRVAGAPLLDDPLMLLAALTEILPDDTHLTDLSLRRQELEVTGESNGASRLIGLLSGETAFKNLRFSAPVVHVADSGQERFSIKAAVLH